MARQLTILPRFKRDYRTARKHPEFDPETLQYVFDLMISGSSLPEPFRERRLDKRSTNWAGMTQCHLGADLLLIYRVRRDAWTTSSMTPESSANIAKIAELSTGDRPSTFA